MNELNSLENQLRSWTPRRPSDKVAEQIFFQGQPAATGEVIRSHAELFRWLAPALACGLTLLAIAGGNVQRSMSIPEIGSASSYVMMSAFPSSNTAQQVLSLSKMNVNLEWNVWPQVSFRSEANWPSSTNR